MKRKTLPKARHFSQVENRLCVGGGAAKEFPAPQFSRPCARGVGGVYKVASAGLLEQLGGRTRDAMGAAWPGTGDLPPATALEARPEARRTHEGRPRARSPVALSGRAKAEGAGEGGGCSLSVVNRAAIVVKSRTGRISLCNLREKG